MKQIFFSSKNYSYFGPCFGGRDLGRQLSCLPLELALSRRKNMTHRSPLDRHQTSDLEKVLCIISLWPNILQYPIIFMGIFDNKLKKTQNSEIYIMLACDASVNLKGFQIIHPFHLIDGWVKGVVVPGSREDLGIGKFFFTLLSQLLIWRLAAITLKIIQKLKNK